MELDHFKLGFIGLLFCILAAWAAVFLTNSEKSISVQVPTPNVICECYESDLSISVDNSGLITHRGKIVSEKQIIDSIKVLVDRGWRMGVIISASSNVKHSNVVQLTDDIRREFNELKVVWTVREET
jgi:biopolymer transport protein ExbD